MGQKIKRTIKVLTLFYESILEIIYPKENYCIICGAEECDRICENCLKKISKINSSDFIESYGHYGGVLKQLILMFKFQSNFSAGDILAGFLVNYIKENYNYKEYILTYIPISKQSERKRGFNQCKYISDKISKELEIQSMPILKKIRETKEQKTLTRSERLDNVKNIFQIISKNNLGNKGIILIDDVVTTGATLNEAYKVLKENGIKKIKLLTLAKSHI